MTLMIIGLLIFFGTHYFTALARDARAGLVGRFGDNGYKGAYSVLALAGFVLIVIGWRSADASLVYAPPAYMRHVAFALMPFATILLVAAYAPAGKIAAAVKHPMLAGVKVWAFAHLLANGEVRSVILFGAFLVYGVVDRIAVKRRGAPTRAAGPILNDVIAVAIGLGAYFAIVYWLHPYIGGVPIVF